MNKSTQSIVAFGIYLVILAVTLIVAPNTLLPLFGFPPTDEVWIRVVGVVAGVLAFYYLGAARAKSREFYQMTVYGRPAVIVFFTLFVVLGYAKPILILFGAFDLLGAIWTGWALRSEKANK